MRAAEPPIRTENQKIALFLDFDGTLVDFAPRPDLVALPAATFRLLKKLRTGLDGALAIVSGRDIADIDAHLAPLRLAVAGVHGRMRRTANGHVVTCDHGCAGPAAIAINQQIEAALTPLLRSDARLLLERKTGAMALHFRAAESMAEVCRAEMERVAARLPDVMVHHGKCVVEIIAGASTKGTAVAGYLSEPPFCGRAPVYIGDDVTDETAFAVVNAAGGISIKVGSGTTAAAWRLENPAAVVNWLSQLATDLERTATCHGS